MVWSVLQSNSANSTSGSTPGVAFTAANLSSGTVLICAVSCYNAKTNSVTDASANSFTKIGAILLGGSESNGETSLWALATPSGDVGTKPTITAHLDNTSAGVGILIQEVSGILATTDGTAGTSTAATGTNTSPTYSSAAANEYLVAAGGDNGGPETMGQLGSGYSADPKNLNNNSAANILLDYKNSSNGTESGGWSSGTISGGYVGAILVAFQLASTALAVATTALPAAASGIAYSQTLAATGGTAPYTWSVSSGSLPSWASLNSSTGEITGTPGGGDVGSTFTVEVTDNVSATDTQPLTLDVRTPVTLVGSVGTATSTTGSVTGAYGQTPTAGNVLVAAVAAGSTTAETSNISSSSTGWARLTSGTIGNNAAGTDKAEVDYWWKAAAGGDAAPVFTQTLAGTQAMECFIFELAGADTSAPLDDASGVFQSGSSTGSVVFSVTSAALQSYGEFAISVMCQERATAGNWTWSETGSGWTSAGKLPAASSILAVQANSQASAGPAALTDAGSFSTHSTALGAGLIVTILGPVVTSSGVSEPFTEAGAGSDALSLAAGVALAEAGAGTDALALAVGVALAEAGAGADAFTATIPTALTEAGSGSDALGITIPAALAEAGAGADSLGILPGLAEAGSGTDALAISQPTALAEAGAGTDALALAQPTALAEAGAGSDALALTAGVTLAETGAGADAFTATVPTALAESGVGTDALALTQPTALTDAGTGSDSLGVMPGLSEAGAGSDALSVTVASPVPLSDAGTGSDALSLSAGVALAEAGAGADALAITQPTALAEAGAGADALGIAIPAALAEAGAGSDQLAVTAASPVTLAEAGTGADSLAVQADVAVPLTEAGTGADSLAITVLVALTEAGTGADALASTGLVALTEAGAGADTFALAVSVAFTEAGSGADAFSLSAGPIVVTDTDSCHAEDSGFTYVTAAADGCVAADGGEVIRISDSDRCTATDTALTRWVRDTDSCHAADVSLSANKSDSDGCAAADGGERIKLASSDACTAAEVTAPVGIWTLVPPMRTGPGGGWYAVVHSGRTVIRARHVGLDVLRFAQQLHEAREVRWVHDTDHSDSAESENHVTGVTLTVGPVLELNLAIMLARYS